MERVLRQPLLVEIAPGERWTKSPSCSTYQFNDHRAQLNRRINEVCGFDLMEEKSYSGDEQPA